MFAGALAMSLIFVKNSRVEQSPISTTLIKYQFHSALLYRVAKKNVPKIRSRITKVKGKF